MIEDKFKLAAAEKNPRERARLFAEASASLNDAPEEYVSFETAAAENDPRERGKLFKRASATADQAPSKKSSTAAPVREPAGTSPAHSQTTAQTGKAGRNKHRVDVNELSQQVGTDPLFIRAHLNLCHGYTLEETVDNLCELISPNNGPAIRRELGGDGDRVSLEQKLVLALKALKKSKTK